MCRVLPAPAVRLRGRIDLLVFSGVGPGLLARYIQQLLAAVEDRFEEAVVLQHLAVAMVES